jgi:hypothetical protein
MKLTALSDNEILDTVKSLAEHTEDSWNKKDYQGFCRFFLSATPEQTFPESEFNRQINENYDTFGKHTISDFVAIHRNPDNVIVIWKVNFESRKEPGLLMYEFKEHDGEILIGGCSYHA